MSVFSHQYTSSTAFSAAILQTVVPDYRLGLFKKLQSGEFSVEFYCGTADFGTVKSVFLDCFRYKVVANRFFCGKRFLWQVGCFWELISADMVVLNNNFRILSNWLLSAIRKLLGKKTVAWNHIQSKSTLKSFLLSLNAALYDGMICYTESQATFAKSIFRNKPVMAAPNACMFQKDCYHEEVSIEQLDSFIYVGRLVDSKKPALALKAFHSSLDRLPSSVKLIFVGEGPEKPNLEDLVSQHSSLADRVIFTGHISDVSELRNLYSRAICSLSPGYVGLSATQSFSFGCPMLIADKEPHSPEIEACVDGFNAWFFNSDSIESFSRNLVCMYESRSEWYFRRAEISRRTAERYSFEAMELSFVKIINAVRIS